MTTAHVQKQEPKGLDRSGSYRGFSPLTDIMETKEAFVLMTDLPGVEDKDLNITLEKNTLTLQGKVTQNEFQKNETLLYAGYKTGDFERSFTISNEIEQEGIEAKLQNGVLRLTLPKTKELQPRKINIKTA